MPNEETEACNNPACRCIILAPVETGAYCCPQCERSEELEQQTCSCGHPPCDAM